MRNIFRIAIVEDEAAWSASMQQMLRAFEREKGIRLELESFSSIETFLSDYRQKYDVVFMDIELPGMNGMEGARRLRQLDPVVVLIFVTNLAQFAVQGYEVSAMDYLLKPVSYERLSLKLQRALDTIGRMDGKRVIVYNKAEMHSMSIQDILYVEVRGHHLLFHRTSGREVDACGSLGELEEQLRDYGFSRCNSCYLLNMKYITSIHGLTVTLSGGTELQISRRRRKEFVDQFTIYMGKDGGVALSCTPT